MKPLLNPQSTVWRRGLLLLLSLFLFCALLLLPISAEEGENTKARPSFGEETEEKLETLLGQLFSSVGTEGAYGALSSGKGDPLSALEKENERLLSPKNFLSLLFAAFGESLPLSLELFALLLSVLLLSSLFRRFAEDYLASAMGKVISLVSLLSLVSVLFGTGTDLLIRTRDFFSELSALTSAMIPLSAFLYAIGGNVTAAAASGEGTLLFLALTETVTAKLLFPVVSLSAALALISAFLPGVSFGPISSAVKRTLTFLLGFLMMLLSAFLSMKVSLASKADSVSARTVKYVASSMIPVIGGSVADSLRTVGASVEYLRKTVGVAGILLLFSLLIPLLVKLLLIRLAVLLASSAAGMLGCREEERFLSEFVGIYGYLLALAVMSSVMFVFAATLLARTAAAV